MLQVKVTVVKSTLRSVIMLQRKISLSQIECEKTANCIQANVTLQWKF